MAAMRGAGRFVEALRDIAISTKATIQERLAEGLGHLLGMLPGDLPPKLEKEFNEWMERMSRVQGPDGTDAIGATTAQMDEDEAAEAIRDIFLFDDELRSS
jgi:hypothetical protein